MTLKIRMRTIVHKIWIRAIRTALPVFFLVISGCAASGHLGASPTTPPSGDEFSPLTDMIRFYQGPMDHLAPVRFGECPMFPHCSEYALDAVRTHGTIIGWFMTCDRLMRCGRDETDISPEIIVDGKWKTFDPVDRNDLWLHDRPLYP